MRLALVIFWMLLQGGSVANAQPLTPITSVDLPRYMGVWYEVAKFPNWFQRKCASHTQAEYRLLQNGKVEVTNRCRKSDGELMQVTGEARQVGGVTSAQLQVRFAPSWLSALPFVWGDYWIIDLDPGYQWVAISEPEKEYLWILSRQPHISPDVYQALLQRLSERGLDVQRLERTAH